MRLDRILANSGLGSRTDVKKFISKGRVTLDGEILRSGKIQISDEDKHRLLFDLKPIDVSKHLYYIFNKPAGFTSTAEKDSSENIYTFLPEMFQDKKIMPVGRLDKDTTGLLILTNNGELAHRLITAKYRIPRVYYLEVDILDHAFNNEDVQYVSEGVALNDDETARPGELEIISDDQARLTLYEGKFHEVKRIMHALGKEVTLLHRDSYGPLELDIDELSEGEFRKLTFEEVNDLFSAVRLDLKNM